MKHLFTKICSKKTSPYYIEFLRNLKGSETKYLCDIDYMIKSNIYNDKTRHVLIDWMIELSHEFMLRPESLFNSINIMDRFFSKALVSTNKLQLVAVTCLVISSKIHEFTTNEISKYAEMTDNTYNREDIINLESVILDKLEYSVYITTNVCDFIKLWFMSHHCNIDLKHIIKVN